jgi:phosphoglycerate dehydrogenase-like enzyme
MKYKILVITPVRHISGVADELESIGDVTYLDDPGIEQVITVISEYVAIFTNPNKSKVFIGREVLDAATNLKVICTASTGTNHIDKPYATELGLPILSLTDERDVINRISSTAELAFALTLAGLRHVVRGHSSVMNGEWDYTQFIGRQMNCLTIGVIGYGRLGSMYAKYCKAFDSRILVYDPYKQVEDEGIEQFDSLESMLKISDVVAIHVHVTDETLGMVNKNCFNNMKKDVLLVNTARGDIVNEKELVEFLEDNDKAKVATDVLEDEVRNRLKSPLLKYALKSDQVIITPHIGGMTSEAQEIAYGHAARRLKNYFSNDKEV